MACMLFLNVNVWGQSSKNEGFLKVNQSAEIDNIIEKYKNAQAQNKTTLGYRVQIYSESGANSKNSAVNIINNFQKKYSVKSYLSYKQPYYRVRVGDCSNMIEASKLKNLIEKDYPNSFIIKDEVNL